MTLIWHPDTEGELADAAMYYNQRQAGLGEEFIDEVMKVAGAITADPEHFNHPIKVIIQEIFL